MPSLTEEKQQNTRPVRCESGISTQYVSDLVSQVTQDYGEAAIVRSTLTVAGASIWSVSIFEECHQHDEAASALLRSAKSTCHEGCNAGLNKGINGQIKALIRFTESVWITNSPYPPWNILISPRISTSAFYADTPGLPHSTARPSSPWELHVFEGPLHSPKHCRSPG